MLTEKVLVIMQDIEKGQKIKKALITGGFQVASVTDDPFAAIRTLRTQEIHVTLIDTSLVKMSYMQFAEMIDNENLGPVICLGNQAFRVLNELPASVYGVLSHTVTADQLFTTIKMSVRQYQLHHQLRNEVIVLRRKLSDRKIVDQAKRLLMDKEGISEDEAYEKIRKISMNKRMSLRLVSDKIIEHMAKKKQNLMINNQE